MNRQILYCAELFLLLFCLGTSPFAQAQYTAPNLNMPASGSTLTGASQDFSWSENSIDVRGWWLYVGTSSGGTQIYNSHLLDANITSIAVDGLPTDGSTIHSRLWYRTSNTGASWEFIDRQFTAHTTSRPSLVSPAHGSQLIGEVQSFEWTDNQVAVNGWWLYVGTTAGNRQLYNSGFIDPSINLKDVRGIPLDGAEVYVRLWYRTSQSSAWQYRDYVFTAESVLKPSLTLPAGGETLVSASQLYAWSERDTSVMEWWLYVGTSPGGHQLHDSRSLGNNTSTLVANLPADGSQIYNRLWYRTASGWSYTDTGNTSHTDTTTGPQLSALHRSGQTFLTWQEPDSQTGYHVYRHNQPITSANLAAASRLTSRWGPLGADTSRHRYPTSATPDNLIIADLATPLSDTTGLFVHTIQSGEAGSAYYAVTAVDNGVEENTVLAASALVIEAVSSPAPVLAVSVNGGSGRVYTQFMDYANWNPTLAGYAYNYSVALPANYDTNRAYPLQVSLHAYNGRYRLEPEAQFGWDVIQVFPDDPGSGTNGGIHTWWFGFAADHNFINDAGLNPATGSVVNFTEQRVLRAVDDVIVNTDFSVDTNLVYAYGHSMGASGALSLGIRYGNVISGIYASQPMTDYRSSPTFQDEFRSIWGNPATNLLVEYGGPRASHLQQYGVGGASATGVWDWMDHNSQLVRRRGEDIAFMIVDHGKADTTIDWNSQGTQIRQALTDANVGFAGVSKADATHSWMAFEGAYPLRRMFGFGFNDEFPWRYPLGMSFIGVQNASDSGAALPGASGNDLYNQTIEWSTPSNDFNLSFDTSIAETATRYDVSLRSTATGGLSQTADITPRRTQLFMPAPGTACGWQVFDLSDNTTLIDQGGLTVDTDGLATANSVLILPGSGSRLVVDC